MSKLKQFLKDINQNPGLQQQYRNDRETVLTNADLNDDERNLLRNEDVAGIAAKIKSANDPHKIEGIINVPGLNEE